MRADLDRLFSAMGAYADTLPDSSPEPARRRGDVRRRTRLAVACATLVLLVGAAAAVTRVDLGRGTPPATPTPRPTVAFTTLTPAGPTIPMPLGLTGVGLVNFVGDRVFVAGLTEQHHLLLAASELGTGRVLWPTIDNGRMGDWHAMFVGTDGILLVAARPAGTDPAYVAMVFDPATGAKRWELTGRDFGAGAVFDSVIVTASATEHAVRGLDWGNGTERWRIPLAVGERPTVTQGLVMSELNGLSRGYWPDLADQRLYLIGVDGTVRVYDGNTGAPLVTRANAAPRTTGSNKPAYFVFDNLLYSVSGDIDIQVADLAATTTMVSPVYAAPSGAHVRSLSPCGAGRVCIVEDSADGVEIVAVDTATRAVVWRRPALQARYVAAIGDRILTDRGQLYDLDGRSLGDDAAVDALWASAGSALILSPADLTDIHSDTAVTGLSTVDGLSRLLGRIPPVRGSCARTAMLLACPAPDGVHLWRFTDS